MKTPVHVISIGHGNISSVSNVIEHIGGQAINVTDKDQLLSASRLIIPGIGHFETAMQKLEETGLGEAIVDFANSGKPVLGICLGMQLLGTSSEEGNKKGLSLLNGSVVKMTVKDTFRFKIPHNGWNTLLDVTDCKLLSGIGLEDYFFFLHGYKWEAASEAEVHALSCYEQPFPVVVGRDNIWGVQFHPEKSHEAGLRLLTNFMKL